MNKMGMFQRFWCLIVTVALLLGVAGIYPESRQKAVQADGLSHGVQTARAIIYSNEVYTPPVSAPAVQQDAVQVPKASTPPVTQKKGSEAPPKTPASVPVAAPAREQIITSMKVTATGYTAGYESTGKTAKHPEYGITYSGVKVRRDKNTISTIAADPKVLPLGSILYVPDYGYAVVADTGSAIKGRKIDLYFATTKQVYKEWGKKTVVVHVIKRGNGKCTEAMLKNLSRAIQTYNSVPPNLLEEVI
ncbi:3D domain-containing protein [Paenibacillus sp. NPDC057934]|uniref:3D domain-containing protein n=1 Tax=Paenibacillus sp. NPDC057934 TaxID=3346282 RepID=UPI0036D9ECC2